MARLDLTPSDATVPVHSGVRRQPCSHTDIIEYFHSTLIFPACPPSAAPMSNAS